MRTAFRYPLLSQRQRVLLSTWRRSLTTLRGTSASCLVSSCCARRSESTFLRADSSSGAEITIWTFSHPHSDKKDFIIVKKHRTPCPFVHIGGYGVTAWGYSGLCPLHDVAKLESGNRSILVFIYKIISPNPLRFSDLEWGNVG